MKSTFELSVNGKNLKIEAEYVCVVKSQKYDMDGIIVNMSPEPVCEVSRMTAYVNGEKFDSCSNDGFWRLVDLPDGGRKIWGMNIAFTAENAKAYEIWLSELLNAGTSKEVKNFEKGKKAVELQEDLEFAKEVIKRAESQKSIPSREEAVRRMKAYKDIANEGGSGYVPYIYSKEDYRYAKKTIELAQEG